MTYLLCGRSPVSVTNEGNWRLFDMIMRYTCVIWFIFLVLHVLLIIFKSSSVCCINEFTMKKLKYYIRYRPYFDFVTIIGSAHVLMSYMNTHVHLVLFTVVRGIVYKNRRCNLDFFEHVFLWCLSFDPRLTIHQSNVSV